MKIIKDTDPNSRPRQLFYSLSGNVTCERVLKMTINLLVCQQFVIYGTRTNKLHAYFFAITYKNAMVNSLITNNIIKVVH